MNFFWTFIYFWIAFFLLILFFLLESFIRFGEAAKSFKASSTDRNSTKWLGRIFLINYLLLLATFLFYRFHLGMIDNPSASLAGDLIMILGLGLRITATLTLREYYTRTLKTQEGQKIISHGIYKFIRHPGYLGLILLWSGAGLASGNYIIVSLVFLLTAGTYLYRIHTEEEMLISGFGSQYEDYMKRSWRLVPFIY